MRLLASAEEFCSEASRTTGLSDFGPGHYRRGLTVFLASLNSEARLAPEAVTRIRAIVLRILQKRLRLHAWLAQNPHVYRERITAPLVIVGFPRSGSSILHELLALDPRNRCPLAWEVEEPLPPPRTASYHSDPRIARFQRELDRGPGPGLAPVPQHRTGAQLPAEDMEITKLDFANYPSTRYFVPSFTRYIFEEIDYRPVYRSLSMFLGLLQSDCPGGRWVLKSHNSTNFVPDLLREYPEARLIWLHRDPIAATASAARLIVLAASGSWHGVAPVERVRDVAHWRVSQARAAVNVSRLGLVPRAQRIDIHFGDLSADTVGTVRKIYEHFGLGWTPALSTKMTDYLRAHPPPHRGGTLADAGLDIEALSAAFGDYVSHFSIPGESG